MEKFLLFAENESMQAALICEACERAGLDACDFTVVPDGQAAIEYMQKAMVPENKLPGPSVLITDMKMPKVGGIDLLAWVRNDSYYKKLPVVLLGIVADEKERQIAEELKCNSFMEKPFQFADWLALVKRFFDWPPYAGAK